MKDAGFPLFPHGVGGGAQESPVVHGVLRCVAQTALSAIALGSLVGHPGHYIESVPRQSGHTAHRDSSIT